MLRNQKLRSLAPATGYTLIELLVTITIIAILAIISFTAFSRMRDKAQAVAALSSLRQVGSLHTQYSTENYGNINTV
ncbi:MAG: prepilin-type N-terminal cleavage/methylation domain-containing protein [Verrucomicrobiales bacterium]